MCRQSYRLAILLQKRRRKLNEEDDFTEKQHDNPKQQAEIVLNASQSQDSKQSLLINNGHVVNRPLRTASSMEKSRSHSMAAAIVFNPREKLMKTVEKPEKWRPNVASRFTST
jgi:nitrate/nitrite-specific signal transduction histidine kinase